MSCFNKTAIMSLPIHFINKQDLPVGQHMVVLTGHRQHFLLTPSGHKALPITFSPMERISVPINASDM